MRAKVSTGFIRDKNVLFVDREWYDITRVSIDFDGDIKLWFINDRGNEDYWWWTDGKAVWEEIDEDLETEIVLARMK